MKSCISLWIMPDMCQTQSEGMWVKIEIVLEGTLPPHQHFLISPTFASNLCLHISGIVRTFVQLFFEITIFKWTFEVELLEFLVSTLKSSAEWGKTRSEKPNLIQNSVAKVEWNLPNPLKFESEEISVGKLYFQLATYFGILVGFGWKVDGQRGQNL